MAFIWTETLVRGSTAIKADHINELHANIDTVRGTIVDKGTGKAVPGYSWSRHPITKETDIVLASDFVELQTALDEGYDKNVCISDLAINNSTYKASEDATINAIHYATVKAGHDITHLVNHYGSNQALHYTGVLAGNDSTYYVTDNGNYTNNVESGNKAIYDISVKFAEDNSADEGDYVVADSLHYISYCTVVDAKYTP